MHGHMNVKQIKPWLYLESHQKSSAYVTDNAIPAAVRRGKKTAAKSLAREFQKFLF